MHPSHILDDETMEVISLWQQWRPSMAGIGPMPFAGGSAEQPSALMDAFSVCNKIAGIAKPRRDEV